MRKLDSKQTWLVALIVVVAGAGAVGGWRYNATAPLRAADDSAVVRTGADASVVVPSQTPAPGYATVTMPFRNDSPYAITLTSLTMPFATALTWDAQPLTLQPGQTGYPLVEVPTSCLAGFPADGSGPARTPPPTRPASDSVLPAVYLKVTTVDGKEHGITLGANGALEAATYNCGENNGDE